MNALHPYFHSFILPFMIGMLVLFIIIIWKFYNWITRLDRRQRAVIKQTFFTTRIFPALWQIIKEIFKEVLLHVNITRHSLRLGYMHRSIAFGWFLLIVVGFIETSFYFGLRPHAPWVPVFFRFFVHEPHNAVNRVFATIMDALLLYVLSGVMMAFIKSFYSRLVGMHKTTRLRWSDMLLRWALWLIFPLRLMSESITACLYGNGGFLTQGLGNLFNASFAYYTEIPFWTAYSFALGTFFVFLPFSRYMHIFAEPLLIVLRNMGVREGDTPTGYSQTEYSACSRCGLCIDDCPLNTELNINNIQAVYLLRNVRHKLPHRYAAKNCLMCDRCMAVCPVGIDINTIRRQERDKGELDVHNSYDYVGNIQSFNAIGRVIYFGGCMSHLTPGIIESMKKIFTAAHQKYWMMDENATICCGRPLLQQGFVHQAAELRRKNTKIIAQSHAQYLITSCPICYRSFTQEYNLPIKVLHHTEYIAMLLQCGKLKPKHTNLRVAYHDPCELGRGCGIYDAPRTALQSVAALAKVEKERASSMCCGCNLGNTALDTTQQLKVRDATLLNLTKAQPDAIATACPMCKKAFQHATHKQVFDVAELIATQL